MNMSRCADGSTVSQTCAAFWESASPGTIVPSGRRIRHGHGSFFWFRFEKIYKGNPDNRNYGVGRILLALEQRGVNTSLSTVRRAMKKGGLLKAPARRPQGLTKADAAEQKAEKLICRNFTAAAANQKWLTDITQIPCVDGKLYIAAVLDCYNGEIVGLAMDDNMNKELCVQAFRAPVSSGVHAA